MNPLGLVVTFLLVGATLFLSRRAAALSIMCGVCYITQGQQLNIGGFHFTAIRFILLAGLARVLLRRELRDLRKSNVDWVLNGFALAVNLIPIIRMGTHEELVYRLGCTYDILLPYWIFRAMLQDWDEAQQFLRNLAVLIAPLALEMER